MKMLLLFEAWCELPLGPWVMGGDTSPVGLSDSYMLVSLKNVVGELFPGVW